LTDFWTVQGALPRASATSSFSDPIVTFDDTPNAQRFIVGDQDVDFTTHVSTFDIAVSRTSNPTALNAANWAFYQITTTEANFDADYPGNFGFNHDAFVFTLNMFGVAGPPDHVQVTSVNVNDLVNTVPPASLHVFHNDFAGFSLRPTAMHDSATGDPMWLVEEGNNPSINVVKMTGVLSNSATFTTTNLAVNPFTDVAFVPPLQPDGTPVTSHIDSRILNAAMRNQMLVTTTSVSVSPTEDDARWYVINTGGATPTLSQQGDVSAGNNTYLTYPAIDINPSGDIGMTFLRSGTDSPTDFMSMYVTGRSMTDPVGTMRTPTLVQAGQAIYTDFAGGRAGDLSAINIDPNDGTFWVANEFANTEAGANWGTFIANFSLFGFSTATVSNGFEGAAATLSAVFTSTSPLSAFTVTVNFGDGSPIATLTGANGGIIDNGNGSFTAVAGHTWAEEGTYNVTLTLTDSSTGRTATTTTPITIADAPLIGNAVPINGKVGEALLDALVATFTDTNPNGTLSDFSGQVTWADDNGQSHSTPAVIVPAGGTTFDVFASDFRTYGTAGPHAVTVVITDVGGASLTLNTAQSVANNPAVLALLPFYAYDSVPQGPLFLDLENALTNLLTAQEILLGALLTGGFGGQGEALTNVLQASTTYFQLLLKYDAFLG
jgi:hypothetical protein